MYLFSMVSIVVPLSLFVNPVSFGSMLDLILVCSSRANMGSHVMEDVKHDIHYSSSIPHMVVIFMSILCIITFLSILHMHREVAYEKGIEHDIYRSSPSPISQLCFGLFYT